MSVQLPSYSEQVRTFDMLQQSIDMNLREAGFEAVLASRNLDASLGRIVVGRSFIYSTQLADVDLDLDPLASRMGVRHEVGLLAQSEGARSWYMLEVSRSLLGGPHEPIGVGTQLSTDQLSLVHDSIYGLLKAKNDLVIPQVEKDLMHI